MASRLSSDQGHHGRLEDRYDLRFRRFVANINRINTAYSIGKFSYVDKDNTIPMSQIIDHEAGHSLSLGAFGTAYHLVGWVDEFGVNSADAFAEKIAEGNVPGSTRPTLPMWT